MSDIPVKATRTRDPEHEDQEILVTLGEVRRLRFEISEEWAETLVIELSKAISAGAVEA